MEALSEEREALSVSARRHWLLRSKSMVDSGGILFLLGLGLYAFEYIIRTNAPLMPVKAQIRLFKDAEFRPLLDSTVGLFDEPNVRQWVATSDFEYFAETDSWGFPNRMPWPSKLDLLFLGDSLITGGGVGIDRQFSSLVAQAFPGRAVLNLGISGAAPNRQLRAYRKFSASLHPSLVVSCIYLAADLNGELAFDAWLKEGAKTDYEQFRHSFGDKLQPKSFWTRVQRRCLLCGKMNELALRWTGFPDRFSFPTGQEVLLDIEKLRSFSEGLSSQDQRLALILASLKEIRALAKSQGAELLAVLIPSKEEIYAGSSLPEVLEPVHILEQCLREQKFDVLSVYDAFATRRRERAAFFTHDIHLNAYGNQIVADRLVEWLKEKKLPASNGTSTATSKSGLGSHKASS